jgi:tight adherence protein C
MTIALLTFLGVFLMIASTGLLVFYRESLVARLASVVGGQTTQKRRWRSVLEVKPQSAVENIISPFQRVLPRSPEEVTVLQKRLIRAGFRQANHVNIFYGMKVLVPIVLCVAATVTGLYAVGPFFIYACAGGIGFLVPDFVLGNLISRRQLNIRLGLPEALDLLVISVEAGLSLDQAMMRVAQELRLTQPAISDELGIVNLEQKAGRPRAETWKNFAARTDVTSVRALVNTLVQADSLGSSVAKTLRVYSDTLRTQRRQQAEEQAAKTTVKLVFPLVFFIFPSLFVVAVGPAAIVLLESIDKYLLN